MDGKSTIENRQSQIHMKLAYVAGPYRAATEWGVDGNIRLARLAAARAWRSGYAVICPHSNTAFMGGVVDDQVILEGDKEMLRKCDVIILLPGHEKSAGTIAELEEAVRHHLDVCDYDAGRDRIVMRAKAETLKSPNAETPLRCSHCEAPEGDPRQAWIFPDDSVMCAGCVGGHVRCEVCTVPLLGKTLPEQSWRGKKCVRCTAREAELRQRRSPIPHDGAGCDDGDGAAFGAGMHQHCSQSSGTTVVDVTV